jgi:ABC-type multidrug transport system fused ATPase/permease subunit
MDDRRIVRSTLLNWFSSTLAVGYTKKLSLDDLPSLPAGFDSDNVKRCFQASSVRQPARHSISPRVSVTSEATHSEKWATHLSSAEEKNKVGVSPLLWTILRCYGGSIAKVGVLKAIVTALSFVGPILLGYIVRYLENGVTRKNISIGVVLVALLGFSSALSAMLNTNYNVRTTVIKNNMQGALIRIIFSRCLSLPLIARKELFLTDSQINNLIQVDIDQVSNCLKSIHDLWALPVQILVACILLYVNIKAAFLVGVTVIIVMIPFNSLIAKRIGKATESLMKAKDARVKVVTEALGNVVSMKMAGLEVAVLHASGEFRAKELKYLAQRKYLDAVCVFLWALTPVIVPFATFIATVYLGVELSAAEVVTALALLNMLIFPMNALPWVINGLMEARVSVRRLAKVLSSEDGKTLFVKNRFARKNRHKVKFWEGDAIMGSDSGRFSDDSGSIYSSSEPSPLTSAGHVRQPSGDRELRREELTLHIPATVWSYVTTYELKRMLGDTPSDGAVSPLHAYEAHNADALRSAALDVESQLRSPLLTHSDAPGTEAAAPPFTVSVDDVRLRGAQLLGIVGATGSGKSSVLLGILGEIRGHKKVDTQGRSFRLRPIVTLAGLIKLWYGIFLQAKAMAA